MSQLQLSFMDIIWFYYLVQVNFGPVNNPGETDTHVILEIAFDTDLELDADDYSLTLISVGTVDAAPSDFTVIENVSDL